MSKGIFHNKFKIISDLDRETAHRLFDLVNNNYLKSFAIFKDNDKCFVAKFNTNILSGCFVLKIPRARHARYWERFQTLFRDGESLRQFYNFKKLKELGFNGPTPVLAAEKRNWGVVIDSFMIYTYVDGRLATSDDVDEIGPELIRLLNLGFTRKDPQPQNFVIASDGVYFIDFNIKKPFFLNKFRCCLEYCKFLETVPDGSRYIDRITNFLTIFFLANLFQKYISSLRKIRRRISNKIKNNKKTVSL